jgi:hypothetical protein
MIKINIIIDNIMQHLVVVIGKTTINQIKIINITNRDIIKILDFSRTMLDVIVGRKEGHVKNDCLVWEKIIEEEEKNSKLKVGVNVAMVKWD